jgi:hypothetical protein
MSWEREGKGRREERDNRYLETSATTRGKDPCFLVVKVKRKLCPKRSNFSIDHTTGGRESKMDTQIFIKSWAGLIPMTIDESTTVKNVREFLFINFELHKSVVVMLSMIREGREIVIEEGEFENNTLLHYGIVSETTIIAKRKQVHSLSYYDYIAIL